MVSMETGECAVCSSPTIDAGVVDGEDVSKSGEAVPSVVESTEVDWTAPQTALKFDGGSSRPHEVD